MKLVVVGGLLAVGIIVVGSLTLNFMQENETEQLSADQSVAVVAADNQNQSDAQNQTGEANAGSQALARNASNSNVTDNTEVTVSLYGNMDQSGTRVHQAVNELLLNGTAVKAAIQEVINYALANDGANLLSPEALNTTTNNTPTVLAFMENMVAANDLFPATKISIENNPEDVLNIINAGVVLYPDFAQEVINAAVMTGEMDSNAALLAALAAGADPATVSEATAAGVTVDGAGQPFDGIGGAGADDGLLGASAN